MLFNSFVFVVFAIIFFAIWSWLKNKKEINWIFLTVASFVFYGWWDWRFLFLIVLSGFIDFFVGLLIERDRKHKKFFLILSLIGNLGMLGVFKYSNFILTNINNLLLSLGWSYQLELSLPSFFQILPVGISFYTFQSMSYTIDVYRGQLKPTKNIFHFFAYLSMFPQLVAGPIVRAADLLPQLKKIQIVDWNKIYPGLRLLAYGYFKKMVVADGIAHHVNLAFSQQTIEGSCLYWWLVMITFAIQIYCDFSGYSDIARGLAKLMGLDFPANFRNPYISTSFKEFWQRWHISLSSWFRDYVYIPLGGSKKGTMRAVINMSITMVLSGLWHGAAWGFIIWGGCHALYSSVEKIFFTKTIKENRYRLLRRVIVLLLVLISWVFFRAENLTQAFEILAIMFSFSGTEGTSLSVHESYLILFVFLRHIYVMNKEYLRSYRKINNFLIALEPFFIGFILIVSIYFRGRGGEFIYFQF